MPIRIYSLAKELKLDSKELVDICTKAGILGKGSALASLDDAELEKVKAFLGGATKKPAAAPESPDSSSFTCSRCPREHFRERSRDPYCFPLR